MGAPPLCSGLATGGQLYGLLNGVLSARVAFTLLLLGRPKVSLRCAQQVLLLMHDDAADSGLNTPPFLLLAAFRT